MEARAARHPQELLSLVFSAVPRVRDVAETLRSLQQSELRSFARTAEADAIHCCGVATAAVAAVLGVELHDTQVAASLALASGWSVQMRTGEGKTFAAIGPAITYAAAGQGVHVVTANR